MSWRPGLIAIPVIPLSLHPKTRLRLRKIKGKKAYAIPVANLDIRETIRQLERPEKVDKVVEHRAKTVLTVGVCWLIVRRDNFLPWNDVRY